MNNKIIEVNNGREIIIKMINNGVKVVSYESNGVIDKDYVIPDGEIVMLLNYYLNCKFGVEKSNYIMQGKLTR